MLPQARPMHAPGKSEGMKSPAGIIAPKVIVACAIRTRHAVQSWNTRYHEAVYLEKVSSGAAFILLPKPRSLKRTEQKCLPRLS